MLIRNRSAVIATLAIIFNASLLGYFKYANFFTENISNLFYDGSLINPNIILPLAISFFTFQQIAYIVDCYQGKLKDKDFLNYSIFVTFFPQLIAGPIVHHKEMIPQFKSLRTKLINYANIALGIFILSVGVFKKIVIADYFASIATPGFNAFETLSLLDSWKTSLSYTLQLYFDFSGYSDMAIGSALIFNIKLPFNFNQPYKSLNIKEFWQKWHMTLSRFLKDYIYIPLGGSRVGKARIYINLMLVFLISGLWHGAGWTFIFWGFLHGSAICIHYLYSKLNFKMHKLLAWFITFNFVNMAWVFFRADSFNQATTILQKMFGLNVISIGFHNNLQSLLSFIRFNKIEYFIVLFSLFLTYKLMPVITKDTEDLTKTFKPDRNYSFITIMLLAVSLLSYHKTVEFLYFNF
jgi:D-alanyl-lipoteichoic acid acyltransferase DltB (MBOAT superfamily)